MDRITPKQEEFAKSIATREFDYEWQAYEAHYDTDKMSKNAIYVEACRLRQNPKVSLRIKELEEQIIRESQSTLDEVLVAMSKRVRVDLREFFNEDSSFKDIHELTKDQAMCVSEFSVQELWDGRGDNRIQVGELKKVKLIDLKGLWDMFLKKYGSYVTNVNIKTEDLSHIEDIVKGIEE